MDTFVINYKKLTLILCFVTLFVATLFSKDLVSGQEGVEKEKNPISYVIVANLSENVIDVRIGETKKKYNFKSDKLSAFSSTFINELPPSNEYNIFFRINRKKWFFLSEDFIEPYKCAFKENNIYCILINEESVLYFYDLGVFKKSNDKSYIAFLNGSANEVTKIKLGKEWEDQLLLDDDEVKKDNSLVIKNLEKYGVRQFREIVYDNYSLFWQFYEQKDYGKYSKYMDESTGNSGTFELKSGRLYIYMTWYKDHLNYASIYDVTPR